MHIQEPTVKQETWRIPGYGDAVKPDYLWAPFTPIKYVIHYGGGGPYLVRTLLRAIQIVRGWWRFHVKTRGWRDIAYNAFAWKKLIILRGLNQNGAHKNSNVHGRVTFTVVFPIGPGEVPRKAWLEAFARQWLSEPMPVTDHGSLPDQGTQCAGKSLKQEIADEFWLHQWVLKRSSAFPISARRRWANRALAYRLNALGYDIRANAWRFAKHMQKIVKQFQVDRGLVADGKVGPETLRELGKEPTNV